jgi:hypothetical protein
MKASPTLVLMAVSMLACSSERRSSVSEGALSPAPPALSAAAVDPPLPSLREIPVGLSRESDGSRCQVTGVARKSVWRDDVVRWAFRTDASECKQKRVKIRQIGDEIDCQDGAVVARNIRLPLEECERDLVTGEVGSTIRLSCSVPSNAAWGCYKYTIAGDVINGDPEIEIERPRLSPPPTSTPTLIPPPPD